MINIVKKYPLTKENHNSDYIKNKIKDQVPQK